MTSAGSLRFARRAFICTFAAFALLAVASRADAATEFDEFGFASVSASESTSLAGAHPDLTTKFVFNNKEHPEISPGALISSGRAENIGAELPPGLTGNPDAVPRCSTFDFTNAFRCPVDSQVGTVTVLLSGNAEGQTMTEPLFNLEPAHGRDQVARLGFPALFYPTYIDISVRTGSDYGIMATVHQASGQAPLIWAKTELWGVPASPLHDPQRLSAFEAILCGGAGTACFREPPNNGLEFPNYRESGLTPRPFLTNPTACENQEVRYWATSYQLPGQVFRAATELTPITGCEELSFAPQFEVDPSSHAAGAPTGLKAALWLPQNDAVNLRATSALRKARVTLPEGMTISSAGANGLEGCSPEQVALGREVESNCPDAAKLGSATLVSPALPEPIHGSIYQRTPEPGNLFRLWLVTDEFGLHLKLPGQITADKQTGRLTVVFDETPQLPVEKVELSFKGGPTAPLKNPNSCGTHRADYEFIPWSGSPPVVGESQMVIDVGCDATSGFAPSVSAGVSNPVAGSFSPLIVGVTRPDGDDNLAAFDLDFPSGMLAKLKGVPLCPDLAAATANCPADSQIGTMAVATGAGSEPLWIPQPHKAPTAIYLAGAYGGAPNSVVVTVPAQAGPFDLGTVVVRATLSVDPDTARASVKTDPLPQILEGVPVLYRTVHAQIDRDHFAVAPTNCRAMTVDSTVTSVRGAVAHPRDRFQVGDCAALSFHPKLRLKLRGGTKRGDHPALTATLTTGKNEANIRGASVALPHAEFLAQEHIGTICTRVQFAQDSCPKDSIYGYAKATTPLLAAPLKGPVYLRSSNHELPDLVVALHGQFDINLHGRIDSVHGGLRTTFTSVPDAPVTKFILKMKGGKKGLLVNSQDICAGNPEAVVKMAGQNGRATTVSPALRAPGCRRR